MDKQLKKLLIGVAVVAHIGVAYYLIKNKLSDQPTTTETNQSSDAPTGSATESIKAETQTVEEPKDATTTAIEESTPKDNADLKPYTDDSIIAVIKTINKKVTIADVKKTVELLPHQMREVPFETLYPILLRQAMDMYILEHNAKKAGFDKNPEVVHAIAERRSNIIVAAFLEQEVEKKVSDDVLKKKYDEMQKSIPKDEKEVEIAHILVKTEAEAKKLIQEIASEKTTFDESLTKSLDEKTKAIGGKIGYLKRMEVAPELFEKILATPEKSIVAEPLNFGKMGSSVLRVLSTRPITIPAFTEIKDELKKAMLPELSQDVIKSVKEKSDLKLFALDGTQIPERSEEELRKSLESDAPSTVDVDKVDDTFIAASFNGGQITLAEVRKTYAALPEMLRILPLTKMYELVLIKVANEKVLMTASNKANIANDAKIKEKIASASLMLVQDAYLKNEAEKLITDTELRAEYERVKKNVNEANEMEYRLRHIMVSSEDAAKDILSKIKKGTSFDDLLSESIDDATKANNGELGYVRKRFLPKEAQDTIAKSVKGTLVNKVIKIDENKFSVMRLEDKRPVTPPSFEQMREKLKTQLITKKAVEVLEKSRKDMDITINDYQGLQTAQELKKTYEKINAQMSEVMKSGNFPSM